MASPCKRRRTNAPQQSFLRYTFGLAAKLRYRVSDFLCSSVAKFLKLAAKVRNTSPEMLISAALPTTAACMGPNACLQMKPYGDYTIPGNLFMIGVAEPGSGKSPAFDFAMGSPLDTISHELGKPIHVSECSKAALLKVQKELGGRGIICADEVSQFLNSMLRRSQADSSGERQLLLTLWGGRGHSVAYASKADADVEISRSGLCVGGFTQPDRMAEIISEMKESSDGLFERFLFWMLPGYMYSGGKIKAAHEEFKSQYLLHSLNPVYQEIFRVHEGETPRVYRFSPEAQEFFNEVEEKVRFGVLEQSSAMVVDSSDEEDSAEDMEPIRSPLGSKYMDQLGRLTLILHVFTSVLQQILGRMAGSIQIPLEIPLARIEGAKGLLDHIVKQNEMILNALFPGQSEFSGDQQSSRTPTGCPDPKLSIKNDLSRKVLLDNGPVFPLRQAYRSRIRVEIITSSFAITILEELADKGLGFFKRVKISKGKPVAMFFKEIPTSVNQNALAELGISFEFYKHQFFYQFLLDLKFRFLTIIRKPLLHTLPK